MVRVWRIFHPVAAAAPAELPTYVWRYLVTTQNHHSAWGRRLGCMKGSANHPECDLTVASAQVC